LVRSFRVVDHRRIIRIEFWYQDKVVCDDNIRQRTPLLAIANEEIGSRHPERAAAGPDLCQFGGVAV
jgi:hypothetical protein